MIESIQIQNFKALQDVSLDLERFTVIVGPNGSGKTSILQAIDFLCRTDVDAHGGLRNPTFPGELNRFLAKKSGTGMSVSGTVVKREANFQERVYREIAVDPNRIESESFDPAKPSFYQSLDHPNYNSFNVQQSVFLDFKVDQLRESISPQQLTSGNRPSNQLISLESEQSRIVMQCDGLGVANLLNHLRGKDPELFERFELNLQSVLPDVLRIRGDKILKGGQVVDALLFDIRDTKGLTVDQISEGTILMVGVLTAVHALMAQDTDAEICLLLDGLELSLHPKAQTEFIVVLRKMLELNPKLQIVATAHSPFLLDDLSPDEVRLTTLGTDGAVICGTLKDHPEFEKWKDAMTPGEMWNMFGEDWLKKRTPEGTAP